MTLEGEKRDSYNRFVHVPNFLPWAVLKALAGRVRPVGHTLETASLNSNVPVVFSYDLECLLTCLL